MSSIVLNGDTSGSVTVSPPAVAGTQTVTLPAASGVLQVSGNMPAFSAYASSGTTVSTATWTKATLDTEEFDTNNNFASNRFTPTVAGYYQLNGNISFGASTSISRSIINIYKNGSSYKQGTYMYVTNTSGTQANTVCALVYANGTTDYFELYGYIEGVGTLTQGQTATYFNGSMVRSA